MDRIIILANSSSGLFQFRRELIIELNKKYEVIACVPETDMVKELEALGAKIILTPINRRGMNPVQDLGLLRQYLDILKSIKPRMVLTYTIKPNVYGGMACSLLGIPYMANITGLGSALENGGMVQKIAITLYRLGLGKAKTVFVQNDYNLQFVKQHHMVNAKKLCLIPGSGVCLDNFPVQEYPDYIAADDDSRSPGDSHLSDESGVQTGEADLSQNRIGFLFISRVMKEKGIEEYLAAAKHFHEKKANVSFTILGALEEEFAGTLDKLVADGVVIYPGKVNDVHPYLKKAECLIHPSFYSEGMSNVCLEAASSGRAVITTDHPGCRETVEDGVTGFLVKPRDSRSLIAAIERFLSLSYEERKAMGLHGRERAEAHFDRNIVVREYLERI